MGALTGMRVLVLGGTGFVGRAIVERLLADGHEPVLFNRGHHREMFPSVEQLIGDRYAGDFAALSRGTWDSAVDVTSYLPRDVAQAMDAVGDRVGRYLFISSHVVIDGAGPGLREPVRDAAWPLTDETYGPSKVACEQDLVARLGPRATIVRPCKVAGPHDTQEGLTHWVRAAAKGGRIELAADPSQPVQLVDSRDLARLVITLLTADKSGAYLAAGQETDFTGLIRICAEAAGTAVEIVPSPGGKVPLMKPKELWDTLHRTPAPEMLPLTPLPATVRDVLAWDRLRP
ncbi:NAD-dependent epimerase/dehydratase family protein [Actinoplanes sp. KI2]|uniref:NAD-dependent epimerase/dehydratase family protein n=1 Tax=Actinoplanes sp. KI2 TaxID=2983315 RepID=UPI0021D58E71|nr:NAD-dependent epimerase/dehydratase family protein [Actinoplanes sp. KI2]MCU7724731.1 NAD-dependent epimerase/dehydratase family protein [Actinoplanes sp. KI2]